MTIYDTIGGGGAVAAAVDDFYVRVLADPDLAPYFAGIDMERLRAHQRAFITAAVGGPSVYSGRSMRAAHHRPDLPPISPAAFDRVVDHLVATLAGLGVPDDVIGQIGGALGPLKPEIVSAEAVA